MARRVCFAAAAVTFVALAAANALLWHSHEWPAVALCGAVACTLAIFERGRYRPRAATGGAAWQPTGERFIDPATGVETQVYEDPLSGARDYRPAASGRAR